MELKLHLGQKTNEDMFVLIVPFMELKLVGFC